MLEDLIIEKRIDEVRDELLFVIGQSSNKFYHMLDQCFTMGLEILILQGKMRSCLLQG